MYLVQKEKYQISIQKKNREKSFSFDRTIEIQKASAKKSLGFYVHQQLNCCKGFENIYKKISRLNVINSEKFKRNKKKLK